MQRILFIYPDYSNQHHCCWFRGHCCVWFCSGWAGRSGLMWFWCNVRLPCEHVVLRVAPPKADEPSQNQTQMLHSQTEVCKDVTVGVQLAATGYCSTFHNPHVQCVLMCCMTEPHTAGDHLRDIVSGLYRLTSTDRKYSHFLQRANKLASRLQAEAVPLLLSPPNTHSLTDSHDTRRPTTWANTLPKARSTCLFHLSKTFLDPLNNAAMLLSPWPRRTVTAVKSRKAKRELLWLPVISSQSQRALSSPSLWERGRGGISGAFT